MKPLIALFTVAMVAAYATDTPMGPIALTGAVVFFCWCYRSDEAGEPVEISMDRIHRSMLCDRNRRKGRHHVWRARKLGPAFGPAEHFSTCPDWYGQNPEHVFWAKFRAYRGENNTTNHAT